MAEAAVLDLYHGSLIRRSIVDIPPFWLVNQQWATRVKVYRTRSIQG
jgi:hypothetical protein